MRSQSLSKTIDEFLHRVLPAFLYRILKQSILGLATLKHRVGLVFRERTRGTFEINDYYNDTSLEFHLDLNLRSDYKFFQNGLDPLEKGLMSSFVKKGDTFFDIGAYKGFYSCYASFLVGETGSVQAFEPDESNRNSLSKTTTANDLRNISLHPLALSDVNEELELQHASDPAGHSLAKQQNENFFLRDIKQLQSVQTVQSVTLDGIIEEGRVPDPDFIKMDVEGAEVQAIRGGLNTLRDFTGHILLSVHEQKLPSFDTTVKELYQLLSELDLNTFYPLAEDDFRPVSDPPYPKQYVLFLTSRELQ